VIDKPTEELDAGRQACGTYGPAREWGIVRVGQPFDHLRASILQLAERGSLISFANTMEKGVLQDADAMITNVPRAMSYWKALDR
jgi:hypothetical protein